MLLEAVHECLNILFIVEPILLVLLNLILRLTELLVELFDVLLRMHHLTVVSELLQVFSDCLIELAGFPNQHLLHSEKVPVLSDRLQKIVKEVIEFDSQVVPNKDNVVAQLHFVDSNIL